MKKILSYIFLIVIYTNRKILAIDKHNIIYNILNYIGVSSTHISKAIKNCCKNIAIYEKLYFNKKKNYIYSYNEKLFFTKKISVLNFLEKQFLVLLAPY